MDLIGELPRLPLLLIALWLLALAWLLNNPEPGRGRRRPVVRIEERCPFCGLPYDREGPLCWCDQAECWR